MKKTIQGLFLLLFLSIMLFSCSGKETPDNEKENPDASVIKVTLALNEFSWISINNNSKLNLNLFTPAGKEISWEFDSKIANNPNKATQLELKDNVIYQHQTTWNEITGMSEERPNLTLLGKGKENEEYKKTIQIIYFYPSADAPSVVSFLTGAKPKTATSKSDKKMRSEWVLTKTYTLNEGAKSFLESDVKEEVKLKLRTVLTPGEKDEDDQYDEIYVEEGSALLIDNKKIVLDKGMIDIKKTADVKEGDELLAKYFTRKLMFISEGKEMKFQYVFLGDEDRKHDTVLLNLIEEDKMFDREDVDNSYPIGSKTWLRFDLISRSNF